MLSFQGITTESSSYYMATIILSTVVSKLRISFLLIKDVILVFTNQGPLNKR